MKNLSWRFWIFLVVVALVGVVVLQNTAAVETRLLFTTVTMPRAVLLFVTLSIGVVCGWFLGAWKRQKKKT